MSTNYTMNQSCDKIDIFTTMGEEELQQALSIHSELSRKNYHSARIAFEAKNFKEASEHIKKLLKKYPTERIFTEATVIIAIEQHDKDVQKHIKEHFDPSTGAYHYFYGRYYESIADNFKAIASYEQAIEMDEALVPAIFRLAYYADLYGDDEKSRKLYEKCLSVRPLYVNALVNLGIIYEDLGDYEKSIQCYSKILEKYPKHPRASLFLKDSISSQYMYVDEEAERRRDKHDQILATPISDFELSVRSRNCLNKMKIKTLGDLIKKSEAELLSYKNFGETSLAEIKTILNKKGLNLGMGTEDFEKGKDIKKEAKVAKPQKNEEIYSMAVTNMELSVRSRKCLANANVKTVGDLVQKSEQELLACKNFGQTSMQEIKKKLGDLGVNLRES